MVADPPNEDETIVARLASEAAGPRGLTLLVMGPSGTSTIAVPEKGSLVIGRATECDVQIDDPKLSRRHVMLSSGDGLHITDLGSRNGTIVHDERITANRAVDVSVGDSITIGGTVLIVQRTTHAARPRHVWSHGYFEARLEEECVRASGGAAPFAAARVRLPPVASDNHATRGRSASDIVGAWLRETDVVAKYAPHEYEVLLIGSTPEDADARGEALTKRLAEDGGAFQVAIAAFPRDGRTPEALIERLSRALEKRDPLEGASKDLVAVGAIERMDRVIQRVAAGVINVLVLGETGVGKEVLARRIHALSPRAKMPLVSINCAALSESLLESELFGHEKGAFTGALAAKQGLLESGNGGTVFLDEAGEMPLGLQAKLLRVLEQREVTRVGAVRPRPIDVRFIAATNRSLEGEIASGRFRQDLYFRLNGISLSLPPLRERVDEIEPLAMTFAEHACRTSGRGLVRISRDAMEALKQYAWPGNIRELRNTMERAVLLCSGDVVTKEHLPLEKMGPVLHMAPPPPVGLTVPAPRAAAHTLASADGSDETVSELPRPYPVAGAAAMDADRQAVVDALEKCGGNQSHAAKLLGISRGTLIKRIADFNLPRPRKRE